MRTQVGGTLLGQGVYGCTFDPAPRCAGESVFRKAVGKITSEDSAEELAIGKAIMALPLAKQYFALPSASCMPQLPLVDPDAAGCRVMTDAGEGTRFSMLIMPNGGETMEKYARNLVRLAAEYKRIFVHLLEGAVIYQRAGYVHNDIHMGNLLVDETGVARYIDFGLAFNVDDVSTWEDANLGTTFKPRYVWQAPEVHAWRMRFSGVRLEDGVRQLKLENPEYAKLEHQFPTRKTAFAALYDVLNRPDKRVAFVRTYGKRFDSWRLGLCMWFLWDDLLRWSPITQTGLYGERTLIRKVLGGLTDFDPKTRLSVGAALAILDPGNRLASD